MCDPTFFPYRLVRQLDRAVAAEDQETVEPPGKPAVVRHCDHRAVEGFKPLLQCLGRLQVQVVRGLVEQQQSGSAELKKQDLEASLLAPGEGLEGLLRGTGKLIPVKRPGGLLAGFATPVLVASVQDLQQGAPQQRRVPVGLREPASRSPLVVSDDLGGQLKSPDGVLPFAIDKDRAAACFREWASSRWFAPSALKKIGTTESMSGSYLPHWGFDDRTTTDYTGQRGDHSYTTETYTTTQNGQSVTNTRQVQHTRWSHAAGRVSRDFVDVLAAGVSTPDADLLEKLGPWSTATATGYQSEYLAGFDSPRYDIDADAGFAAAKQDMAAVIQDDCRADIGGDEQRVEQMSTADQDVLFRLLLLPLWIATYIAGGKTFDVFVNANTGEVIGERPYSAIKIIAAVVAAVAAIAGAISCTTPPRGRAAPGSAGYPLREVSARGGRCTGVQVCGLAQRPATAGTETAPARQRNDTMSLARSTRNALAAAAVGRFSSAERSAEAWARSTARSARVNRAARSSARIALISARMATRAVAEPAVRRDAASLATSARLAARTAVLILMARAATVSSTMAARRALISAWLGRVPTSCLFSRDRRSRTAARSAALSVHRAAAWNAGLAVTLASAPEVSANGLSRAAAAARVVAGRTDSFIVWGLPWSGRCRRRG